MELSVQLALNGLISMVGAYITYKTIPQMSSMFIKSHLSGIDLCKKDRSRVM